MPSFRYRALTSNGELVNGTISAPSAEGVAERVQLLGLFPIDSTADQPSSVAPSAKWSLLGQPRPEDVTVFTRDLALLLKAGARINDALELLSSDIDVGRLRSVVPGIRSAVLGGDSFAEAISRYPQIFPAMYVALVRVGEASGTLDHILELIAEERGRAEALRRRLMDAIRYPAFILFAAGCVLTFFLFFVLPQFAAVLRDFGAKLNPMVATFLGVSEFAVTHVRGIAATLLVLVVSGWVVFRRAKVRGFFMQLLSSLPLVGSVFTFHRASLFCRNLSVLLESGVHLTVALRILADMMMTTGHNAAWLKMVDQVRHGAKFSDALADSTLLPPMAVRMLRLGDESGQLPMLAGRVADFYEAKLQRSLDRVVGIAGPAAIIAISVVVGGLIVSVMTALLSVSQVIG